MFYNGRDCYGLDTCAYRIGMASSQDGISWTTCDNNPVVVPGLPGTWNGNDLRNPRVIYENDTLKMWYHGSNFWPVVKGV